MRLTDNLLFFELQAALQEEVLVVIALADGFAQFGLQRFAGIHPRQRTNNFKRFPWMLSHFMVRLRPS